VHDDLALDEFPFVLGCDVGIELLSQPLFTRPGTACFVQQLGQIRRIHQGIKDR
jgi:hypothetical protein